MLSNLKCYICKNCGKFHIEDINILRKPISYRKDGSVHQTYSVEDYCSSRCSNPFSHRNSIEKIKQTNLKKYGVSSFTKTEEYRRKTVETNLNKYKVENPSQSEEVKNKKIKTNLEKYGVEWGFQSEIVKSKIKETNLDKYGVEWTLQSNEIKEKIKQTNLNKYGVTNPWKNTSIRKKIKDTMLEKYGFDSPTQNKNIMKKIFNTMRENNSFNTSHSENTFYIDLLEYFSETDIIRQYIDDRYPFRCDFYIKSLDLFIELNLFWTHGWKPFDRHDDICKKQFKSWRLKAKKDSSSMYNSALKNWVISDLRKIKIARDNNLNYIMIYSEKDKREFLSNLKLRFIKN